MDGSLVPWGEARVHVMSHSLHYGTAVFEGIRCYQTSGGPAIFRLDEHLERFEQSAAWLHMRSPFSREEMAGACRDVVRKNGFSDCYIRPLLFYGQGPMNFSFKGNEVRLSVSAWPWGAYMGDGLRSGIRVKTVSWRKTPSSAFPSTAKLAGNYVNSCLAFQEAIRAGFDEALLLNEEGRVAEGSGENVFVVRRGTLTTPPVSEDILAGITRDSVMTIARELGYGVREAAVSRAELVSADEVFMTGTAAEVTPIREIDWRPVADGTPGPVTLEVQKDFFAAVRGELPEYRHWLAHVDGRSGSDGVEESRHHGTPPPAVSSSSSGGERT